MNSSQVSPLAMLLTAVLAVSAASAQPAQPGQPAQPPAKPQSPSGIIFSADANSLILLDKNGAQVPFSLSNATLYQKNKTASTFQDIAIPGMKVKLTLAPDGTTQLVTGSGLVGQLNPKQLKAFLGVSDQEWGALAPRFDKIMALANLAADPGMGGGGNGGNNGQNNGNAPVNGGAAVTTAPVDAAETALRSAYYGKDSPPSLLVDNVKAFRAAKRQAREDLAAERKELTEMISPRQEALLVIVGILE